MPFIVPNPGLYQFHRMDDDLRHIVETMSELQQDTNPVVAAFATICRTLAAHVRALESGGQAPPPAARQAPHLAPVVRQSTKSRRKRRSVARLRQ